MEDVRQTIEIVGRSLLEEKAKHGTIIAAAGSGVTLGTVIGYIVAGVAFISSIYVMYKTSIEIKKAKKEMELLDIKIKKEKQE